MLQPALGRWLTAALAGHQVVGQDLLACDGLDPPQIPLRRTRAPWREERAGCPWGGAAGPPDIEAVWFSLVASRYAKLQTKLLL